MSRVEQFENIRCKMRKHFLHKPISSFTKVTDDSWCVRQSAIECYTGLPTCLLKLKKEIKGGSAQICFRAGSLCRTCLCFSFCLSSFKDRLAHTVSRPSQTNTWLPTPPSFFYRCGHCTHCSNSSDTKHFFHPRTS